MIPPRLRWGHPLARGRGTPSRAGARAARLCGVTRAARPCIVRRCPCRATGPARRSSASRRVRRGPPRTRNRAALMTWHNKVMWTEGMFLQPQHFQQQDRFVARQLDGRLGAAGALALGLRVAADRRARRCCRAALAISAARGVLPDGAGLLGARRRPRAAGLRGARPTCATSWSCWRCRWRARACPRATSRPARRRCRRASAPATSRSPTATPPACARRRCRSAA